MVNSCAIIMMNERYRRSNTLEKDTFQSSPISTSICVLMRTFVRLLTGNSATM